MSQLAIDATLKREDRLARKRGTATVTDERAGDQITIGNVTNAQGVAIGRNAQARAMGQTISGDTRIDANQLREALTELYTALGQAGLPIEKTIATQTLVGRGLQAAQGSEVQTDGILAGVQKVGEIVTEAHAALEQGTSLWHSIQTLASILGPLVGGTRVVTGWFGVPTG